MSLFNYNRAQDLEEDLKDTLGEQEVCVGHVCRRCPSCSYDYKNKNCTYPGYSPVTVVGFYVKKRDGFLEKIINGLTHLIKTFK